jgi:ketol-acid reductoisomerase
MRPSQYDGYSESLKHGLKVEAVFLELARKQGFQVHHTSEAADIARLIAPLQLANL